MARGAAGHPAGAPWPWLAAGAAALLALPWYGLEGAGPALPAAGHALLGQATLVPLLLPVLLAGLASGLAGARQPRLMVTAGAAGLAYLWLCSGWAGQAALGWGALLYAAAMLMVVCHGLAWQGWCRGEVFVVASIAGVGAAILVFVFYPVSCVLVSAFRNDAGQFDLGLFATKITDSSIWGLGCLQGGRNCGVALNSLAQASLVGVLSTTLGFAFALVSARTRFPFKRLLSIMSILPVITPPFVIGMALILLFGRSGIVTTALSEWFDMPRSRWLYGMPGLTIAQVLAFTPISTLVLVGVLKGVSPSLEEASQTLRSGPWRTFCCITWPLIRPGLANAFLIAFIESLADFGNPIMLGGNFRVLSVSVYFAVVGAAQDQGQAAVLAIVLLFFSLSAFLLQRAWTGRRSYVTVTGKGDAGLPARLPPAVAAACLAVVLPWVVLTAAAYGIILFGGFVKAIGSDNSFTLEYFLTAFSVSHGAFGWQFTGSAWNSLLTTLRVSLLAMPLTAGIGILTAYLLSRQRFAGRTLFEFMTMLSFAIPGTVVGISYILAFNVPPLELTGTGLILVIAFVFRNMPVGIRAGLANLSQIDRSLDEASLTLGARSAHTLRRVVLPLLRPAVATAMVYAFVRAITSVSAVIFLVGGEYSLATVYIVRRAEFGEFGLAICYSAVLIAIMVVALLGIQAVVGERRIGRRSRVGAA